MTRDHHTSRTLGRKLSDRERQLMAHLYVKLERRERRLKRIAIRHREEI